MSSRSPLVITSHLVLITVLSDGHGRFIRWETEVAYRPGCLNLATADICGWIIVCWGICPVLHVAERLALTRCQQPPYQLIQPECLQTLANVLWSTVSPHCVGPMDTELVAEWEPGPTLQLLAQQLRPVSHAACDMYHLGSSGTWNFQPSLSPSIHEHVHEQNASLLEHWSNSISYFVFYNSSEEFLHKLYMET